MNVCTARKIQRTQVQTISLHLALKTQEISLMDQSLGSTLAQRQYCSQHMENIPLSE